MSIALILVHFAACFYFLIVNIFIFANLFKAKFENFSPETWVNYIKYFYINSRLFINISNHLI